MAVDNEGRVVGNREFSQSVSPPFSAYTQLEPGSPLAYTSSRCRWSSYFVHPGNMY